MTTLDQERDELARLTMKGMGMPIAGFLYWIALGFLLGDTPDRRAIILAFWLTGAVFPVGIVITRLLGGDIMAKSPSLTSLGLMVAALQGFFWPVAILVFTLAPAWTPWTMAILFGSHFLPYWWMYRSPAYAVLAISLGVTMSVGAVLQGATIYAAVPWLAAACYAVAVALLFRETRSMRSMRKAGAVDAHAEATA
jgi:hypothetical protein